MLVWNGQRTLQNKETGEEVLQLSQRIFRILTTLSQDADVEFQFVRQHEPAHERPPMSRKIQSNTQHSPKLCIILYGLADVATVVGDWLGQCDLYLQPPHGCDRNVRYLNPHCLSFDDKMRTMTFDLDALTQTEDPIPDLLAELDGEEILDEYAQPALISTPLHRHQRQALTFMLRREQGWDLTGARDLWRSCVDACGMTRYQNMLSGRSQVHPPSPFSGGILADDMGLGKTCTMLSLIASNPCPTVATNGSNSRPEIKGTLVVAPFSLLHVWENQILCHFHPSSVRVCSYYGARRHQFTHHGPTFDIVITTYNTVAMEWKTFKSARTRQTQSLLFSNHWHRIVLDEAHMIRTRRTVNARAVCTLHATHRWCITGTPIQNRLSDLSSLLRFLKVSPYDQAKTFETEISQPWKSEMDEIALRKLQALMKMIVLRRPRTTISLPHRSDIIESVSFTPEEIQAYEQAKMGTIEVIDLALSANTAVGSAYINALQRINDLRYICNHGRPPRRRKQCSSQGAWDGASFQQELDKLLDVPTLVCVSCGTDIQEDDEGAMQALDISQVRSVGDVCRHCSMQRPPVSSPEDSDTEDSAADGDLESRFSSKVVALVSQLQEVPAGDKWFVQPIHFILF